MRVAIADVAREAGVSKTTVSRVVDTGGEVDRSTAPRVREVIGQLGYVPRSRAVDLARGSSRTVGMLVLDGGGADLSPRLRTVLPTELVVRNSA